MNVNYIAGVPPTVHIDINKWKAGEFKLGYNGECPDKNTIYLYGNGDKAHIWLPVLIHEEYHAILHELGLEDIYHHKVIPFLEEMNDFGIQLKY